LKRCILSSKDSALARSNSCRASFMAIPNSWFDDSENTSRTPQDEVLDMLPEGLIRFGEACILRMMTAKIMKAFWTTQRFPVK
jgi:hypothetical protein